MQQMLQLSQVRAVAVARLVHIHVQRLPTGKQVFQVLCRAQDKTFVGQQHPAHAPQGKGDGKAKRDAANVQLNEFHGVRWYQKRCATAPEIAWRQGVILNVSSTPGLSFSRATCCRWRSWR